MTLRANHLRVTYGDTVALNDVSLHVSPGELVAVFGLNGSGKSTLLRVLSGLQTPDSGDVFVGSGVGWCPQEYCLWPDVTAREHLWVIGSLSGMNRDGLAATIEVILATHGLLNASDDLTSTFSGGMKRRLSLALAQLANPGIVILDEPDAGLDVEGRRLLMERAIDLASKGVAVLLSTHDVRDLTGVTRVIALKGGRLIADASPEDLLNQIDPITRVRVDVTGLKDVSWLISKGARIEGSAAEFDLHQEAANELISELCKHAPIPEFSVERPGLAQIFSDGFRPCINPPDPGPSSTTTSVKPNAFVQVSVMIRLLARRLLNDRLSLCLTLSTPTFFSVFFWWIIQDAAQFQLFVPRLAIFSAIMLVFSASLHVGREFEGGTVDRLRLAHVRPLSYIVAVLLSQTFVGLVGLAVLLSVSASLGFGLDDVELLFVSIFAVTAVACSSLGIAVASVARNVPRAFVFASTTMFLLLLFSGIVFPVPDSKILWAIGTYHAVNAVTDIFTSPAWSESATFATLVCLGYTGIAFGLFAPRWKLGGRT